jgi:hypothetical protein
MKPTKQSKPMQNFFLLHICSKEDDIIRTIPLEPHEVDIMKQLITDVHDNETGGVTIHLKLQSQYIITNEISN